MSRAKIQSKTNCKNTRTNIEALQSTAVLAIYINNVQHTGKCVESVGRPTTSEQVCRSSKSRRGALHEIEQEARNENHTDIDIIISIRSYSK